MNVCALSDLHGDFVHIKPCELVCICGDISPLNIQGNYDKMQKWLLNTFKPWASKLPCNKVIFIAGNHDKCFSNLDFMYTQFSKDDKVTYLFHEKYTYTSSEGKDYTIFGTPYCKLFGNWAFMEMNSQLEQLFMNIPYNCDILLSHDAPFGCTDVLLQLGYYTGEHIGNKPLAEAILQKMPKFVLHGHLRSTSREFENLGVSQVVNCSIKNEYYEVDYDPIYFEL